MGAPMGVRVGRPVIVGHLLAIFMHVVQRCALWTHVTCGLMRTRTTLAEGLVARVRVRVRSLFVSHL